MCAEIVYDIQNNFCTQHVLPMFCKKKSFWKRFTCNRKIQCRKMTLKSEICYFCRCPGLILAIDMKSWLEWATWNLNLKRYLIHIQECNQDLKKDLGNFSHRVHHGHCSHLSPSERPMYGRWSGPARPARHGRAHPCPGDNHCRFHWIGHVWFC